MAQRIILHADLNSFFAMAEQQTDSALRGKPVGVVKAKGRTCIIAASPEAKKYGVKTGSRTYDALKLCPQIILVPANFDKYEHMSRQFINICKTYSPTVEVFSLDECFIDATESEQFWGNVFNIAFEIKDRLKREIGDYMTCSIGISYNRILSKLASNQIKPDGLFWITVDNAISILDKSKLMDICGLGWGLNKHLLSLGIDSFAKLRMCSLPFLYDNFGPFWAVHLYNISRGVDNSSVTPYTEIADAKSVGRTYTTHKPLNNKEEIWRLARNLCEETAAKARTMGMSGRYVGFTLRAANKNSDYNMGWLANRSFSEGWYGHKTLTHYISTGRDLFEICQLISKDWQAKDVIFCGVTMGMLQKSKYLPLPLFEKDSKKIDLIASVDVINDKFGDYTIFPGRLLGIDIIRPEVTGYFGDKAYRLRYGLRD